ncbi:MULTISPECIES: AraC family transcriptional regulator [unclassified Rhizobium]|uniref:AraC family transcriptional regulator n=1 Tax=unclassified Rhizobium TaxID=2613769 RepID=UPI001C8398B2|nr:MULTISPECIES: AraC family transcriptional regulator [unclassified Rhizobium]MBX5242535.1 AraC family transcriptional regulator [Rhizobium sp. NLR22b]MBX5269477.1 AraC family transcriptional regulator [Rhizobium sp. NLR17b]
MDPLSNVLALLKPRSYVSAGLNAGGAWALDFPPPEGIKFNAVISGACWLSVDGVAESVRLEEGDCFLLTSRRAFRLASDPSVEAMPCEAIYSIARDGIATCNGGGDFFLIGSRFSFSGGNSDILLGILPTIVHVKRDSDHAAVLRWSLDRMTRELRDRQPGGFLMAEHFAHVMLMQVLRLHIASPDARGVGWLFALTDRRIGAALAAMHADPARKWTLQLLAERASMSRSTFALHFKAKVGLAPMDYLTRWRMLVAADRLANPAEAIASVGLSLGYDSESAFSTAFKRVMGCSPRQYGAAQQVGDTMRNEVGAR